MKAPQRCFPIVLFVMSNKVLKKFELVGEFESETFHMKAVQQCSGI